MQDSHSSNPPDSGLAALLTIAGFHGIAADEAKLRHEFGVSQVAGAAIAGFTTQSILLAAKSLGLTTKAIMQDPQRLDRAPLPAIAQDQAGNYFIVAKYDPGQAKAGAGEASIEVDPSKARLLVQRCGEAPRIMSLPDLLADWTGELIFFTSKANYAGDVSRFDFSWFIPSVVKYRKLLGEVLLISFVLQIIGLVTPMFFQVVMDKVLVNHAMKTLNVIGVALVAAIVFEVLLTGIRTYVFAHTSSKIDVELGARLFCHLLALPIAYFESRRVGDSVARIRELENIRSFLTGNAITLVLDLAFSFVCIGVMLWYSAWLTLIVVVSIPLYGVLSLLFTPVLRARLNEKFNRGAENQSFLVETISGMGTVKAMAVEPRWTQKWESQLASYVAAGLSVNNMVSFPLFFVFQLIGIMPLSVVHAER